MRGTFVNTSTVLCEHPRVCQEVGNHSVELSFTPQHYTTDGVEFACFGTFDELDMTFILIRVFVKIVKGDPVN